MILEGSKRHSTIDKAMNTVLHVMMMKVHLEKAELLDSGGSNMTNYNARISD